MIKRLTDLIWDSVPKIQSVRVKTDRKLSEILRLKITEDPNSQTFGEWLMTFNFFKSPGSSVSLDGFLTLASGPPESTYDFDWNIAAIFHTLLLSSLYYYLCSMMRLKLNINTEDDNTIQESVGSLCNAIRIFFLVSHSNAIKAYFTLSLQVIHPTSSFSIYYQSELRRIILDKLVILGWDKKEINTLEPKGSNIGDKEDPRSQENYMEDFKDSEGANELC
jgi:hypothetical protein